MKVKDLIEILQKSDQEKEINIFYEIHGRCETINGVASDFTINNKYSSTFDIEIYND